MSVAIPAVIAARLEKTAIDNGFDQQLPVPEAPVRWLGFASTQCPLRVWLATSNELFVAALSQENVAWNLSGFGSVFGGMIPVGAAAALSVVDIPALHQLVRRAFQ